MRLLHVIQNVERAPFFHHRDKFQRAIQVGQRIKDPLALERSVKLFYPAEIVLQMSVGAKRRQF
jgi:hypothetical protein